MHITTYVSSKDQIDLLLSHRCFDEVLIEPGLTARTGQLSLQAAQQLAEYAKGHGLKPVLVWDTLVNEQSFTRVTNTVEPYLKSPWFAVRIRDIGVAAWIFERPIDLPIQLLCEEGSHNLSSLKGWIECFGERLQRLVLSIELPEQKLAEYAKELPVQTEVLGAGRILLFYSPRKLLRRNFENIGDEEFSYREVLSSSSDSHQRPFPTVETIHGTLMYLDKDQFILDKLSVLNEAGMDYVRLDMRHLDGALASQVVPHVASIVSSNGQGGYGDELRNIWPGKTLAPFFRNNNTTKQFKRLRSPVHDLRSEKGLGTVIAAEKGKYLVVQALRSFALSEPSQFVSSSSTIDLGDALRATLLSGESVEVVSEGQIVKVPWHKGVTNGSLLVG